MKQLVVYTACLILLLSCNSQSTNLTADMMVEAARELIKEVKPADVMKIMESEEVFNIIDVREKNEYYYGFIPGSVCIPRGSVEFNIDNTEFWEKEGLYMPGKDETMIVYCKKGKRSALVANTLQQMGYNKVLLLEGGWKNWEMTYPDFCDKNLEMLSGKQEKHDQGGGC